MFTNIVKRTQDSDTWRKIPWNDPDFSRRMLKEHLSQAHDAASRRTPIIEQQVAWIHQHALGSKPSRILDLGCGPGLYSARLAALGHTCTGIDFSPASILYARQHDASIYILGDVCEIEYGSGFDLVMMLFGELNAFALEDAQRIVDKAFDALKPGGRLLLEPHTVEAVERLGSQPSSWYSASSGLFSDTPYLCLEESFFRQEGAVAVHRHYVIDAETGGTTEYCSMLRRYTEDDYRKLLSRFGEVTFYPSLANDADVYNLCAILANKIS